MHRSRPLVLITVVAFAACSRQQNSEGTTTLSQDSALAARVGDYQKADEQTQKLPFPDACGTFAIPAPAPSAKAEAEEVARRGYTAEMLGNMREASSLFRRASDLDETNKSAAYHLGRVSEALSDRSSAIRSYCRYLALSPTSAEAVEARQRVLDLSQRVAQVAAAPTLSAVQSQRTVEAKAGSDHSPRVAQPKRVSHSTTSLASGSIDLPVQRRPTATSVQSQPMVDTVSPQTDGVEQTPALPTPSRPSQQRQEQSGPNRAQTAGIGAVAGAILGGLTGRSVKAAVIGAAGGGVIGGVLPHGNRGP